MLCIAIQVEDCNSKTKEITIMVDPLPCLLKCRKKLAILSRTGRKNLIVIIVFILTASVSLFFQYVFELPAYAQKNSKEALVSSEIVDPLNRIGKGFVHMKDVPKEKPVANNPKISAMLDGSPMETMVTALNARDKEVASYLVAIAKKESDWGRHAPKKAGRECYNYWGYRGAEDTTASGYSCFDSPAQAVSVVGNRIEKLINSHVNTPEKMVVWKCGGNCEAAGGQVAANKWISDVRAYYAKLNS
jgi:hypothetical protein